VREDQDARGCGVSETLCTPLLFLEDNGRLGGGRVKDTHALFVEQVPPCEEISELKSVFPNSHSHSPAMLKIDELVVQRMTAQFI